MGRDGLPATYPGRRRKSLGKAYELQNSLKTTCRIKLQEEQLSNYKKTRAPKDMFWLWCV